MIRNAIPPGVVLSARLESGLPPVRVGKAALAQIVFNLVQNAGDALRGRKDGAIHILAQADGAMGAVRVGVEDNGPGMSEEVRCRCLEPFFTTKTRGLSTGLGLALVSGLVKAAQGTMHIASEVGRGTTIIVDLPVEVAGSPSTGILGRKCVAALSLPDGRLAAHVRSILTSIGLEVRAGEPEDSTDLWVTEVRYEDEFESVRRFVEEDGGRRAIVFGTGTGGDDRVIRLDSQIRPSDLRTRLQDALSDIDGSRGALHAR